MTIDAMVDGIFEFTVVLIYGTNLPIGKVTLVYAKLPVQFVAGLNETITLKCINRFFCNTENIGFITIPLISSSGIY